MGKNNAFKTIIFIYIAVYALACVWGRGGSRERQFLMSAAQLYIFPQNDIVVSGAFKVYGSIYALEGIKSATYFR